jgi:hypothetical protein
MPRTTRLVLLASAALLIGACRDDAPENAADTSAALAVASDPTPVSDTLVVHKTATCGCCKAWVAHMEENGFTVVSHDHEMVELNRLNQDVGLPSDLVSCHTALIGGYVVEGHVPADLVKRLLEEKPQVAGLAVPGMPIGSPGMEGVVKQRYDVIAYGRDGSRSVYATR